jgi:hypothetical protein
MIYIIQKSKKGNKEKRFVMSVSEASIFLYDIKYAELRNNDFYILGSDNELETEKIVNLFSPQYLIKEEADGFDRFMVNPEITKAKRYATGRAKHKSIEKFGSKIQKAIKQELILDTEVEFIFEQNNFEIYVSYTKQMIKIVCSYTLEVNEGFVFDLNQSEFVDIKKTNKILKIVGDVFRRQRHYYRRKGDL